MFTGIITDVGKLVEKRNSVFTFHATRSWCKKLRAGGSVAVNGVCLTIVRKPSRISFVAAIMPETRRRTMLKDLNPHDLVNLELPVTVATLFSGHVVQGHIDGTATFQNIMRKGNSRILTFSIFPGLSRYIVEKGSIAVNGVSLTVIEAAKNFFTVGVIPYTWQTTMFYTMKIGDVANIEVDILAKYVEKFSKEKTT